MFNFDNNIGDLHRHMANIQDQMRRLNERTQQAQNQWRSLFDQSTGEQSMVIDPNWLHPENDLDFVQAQPKYIVEGFLNLSKAQGWNEGGPTELGIAFTRVMLRRYLGERYAVQGRNVALLKRVLKSFEAALPANSRCTYDDSVRGWQNHAVSRVIGNLASTYKASCPFFEVLINSAQDGSGRKHCKPFSVRILANGQQLEERRQQLEPLNKADGQVAHYLFYTSLHEGPQKFLEKHSGKIGENGTRILQALSYLETVSVNSQIVGNCWMKQPMRVLLVALYMEVVSTHKQMSLPKAWENAVAFYKAIQREALPLVEQLLARCKVTEAAKHVAHRELQRRRNL